MAAILEEGTLRSMSFIRAGLGALLIASALAWPSAGLADDPVAVTRAPDISGKFVVGETLRAVNGSWTGPDDTSWGYTWQRCPDDDFEDCSTISGATEATYTLQDADAGKFMRVTLWAAKGDDSARKSSDNSEGVKTTSGTTPPPSTQPPGSFEVVAPASKPGPAIPGLKRITPKPTVRIRGRYTTKGATITLFTVNAPKGSSTRLTCSKGTCPAKSQTIKGGKTTHVKKFERALKTGTQLMLTTTRKGYVSEVTLITIRRKAAPTRSDSCILPGKKSRQRGPRCPSASRWMGTGGWSCVSRPSTMSASCTPCTSPCPWTTCTTGSSRRSDPSLTCSGRGSSGPRRGDDGSSPATAPAV
jgi:hypothetical protein